MKWYEALQYLKYGYMCDKEDWEQTRWLGNLFINANSKKKVTLEETIPFPWEKATHKTETKTKEEIEAEKKKALEEARKLQEVLTKNNKPPVTQTKRKRKK